MMTTKTTFGISDIPSDPLLREQVIRQKEENSKAATAQPPTPQGKPKHEILKEYIDKFLTGEITAAQLEVIKNTLS